MLMMISAANRKKKNRPLITNRIRNPRGEGATLNQWGVSGAEAGPLLPTYWSLTNPARIMVLGRGIEDAIPYTDIRFSNTTGTTAGLEFEQMSTTNLDAGQSVVMAFYCTLRAGTTVGSTLQRAFNMGGTNVTEDFVPPSGSLVNSRQVLKHTRASGSGGIQPRIRMTLAAGYDFTIRVGAPGLVLQLNDPGYIPIPPPGTLDFAQGYVG